MVHNRVGIRQSISVGSRQTISVLPNVLADPFSLAKHSTKAPVDNLSRYYCTYRRSMYLSDATGGTHVPCTSGTCIKVCLAPDQRKSFGQMIAPLKQCQQGGKEKGWQG